MKKIFKIMAVLLLTAGLMFGATTANVILTGTVGAAADLTISTVSTTLDLSNNTTETDLLVATVLESTNNNAGYIVTMNSVNSLNLKNQTTEELFPYTMKYGVAGSEAEVTVDASGNAEVTNANAKTPNTGTEKNILISYAVTNGLTSGTYQDTLSFTISVK